MIPVSLKHHASPTIKYPKINELEPVPLWEKVVVDTITIWAKCCWEINFGGTIFHYNINGIRYQAILNLGRDNIGACFLYTSNRLCFSILPQPLGSLQVEGIQGHGRLQADGSVFSEIKGRFSVNLIKKTNLNLNRLLAAIAVRNGKAVIATAKNLLPV